MIQIDWKYQGYSSLYSRDWNQNLLVFDQQNLGEGDNALIIRPFLENDIFTLYFTEKAEILDEYFI